MYTIHGSLCDYDRLLMKLWHSTLRAYRRSQIATFFWTWQWPLAQTGNNLPKNAHHASQQRSPAPTEVQQREARREQSTSQLPTHVPSRKCHRWRTDSIASTISPPPLLSLSLHPHFPQSSPKTPTPLPQFALYPNPPQAPLILLAKCTSFCMMVTLFAWIAHRFVSSNRCTMNASAASWSACMACDCQRKACWPSMGRREMPISRT